MKLFLRFLVLIGVLGVIAILIVGLSLNALVKIGVETMGPKVVGVPVTLEDVDLSLLSGGTAMRASLNQLLIKNPEGYETAHAFSFPNIQIEVDRSSVLTDTIIVEEVLIVGPDITFEGSLLGSNLSDILDNVKRNTRSRSDDEAEEKEGTHEEESERDVHVKKVSVKDAKITLSLFGGPSETIQVPLPDFELRDIGNPSGGTSLQQVSAKIFEAMYAAIIKTVVKSEKLIPKAFEPLSRATKDLGKAAEKVGRELLKGLFNQ